LVDTLVALYCGSFDPLAPLAGLVASDDDGAVPPLLSAFLPEDLITLSPGQRYSLVLTTFDLGDFGTYEVQLLSPTAHFVPEPGSGWLGLAAAACLAAWRAARSHNASIRASAARASSDSASTPSSGKTA
jgi:hypothetical protein